MITPADDFPIHQLARPIADVGTERNFYDRYFFNGYSSKENIFFGAALCVYPSLNIMDAAFTLAVDGIQHNLRASRILKGDQLNTEVGPIKVKVIEPLNKITLEIDSDEYAIKANITFERRFEFMQEPNMTLFNGNRKIMDSCRMTQHGSWVGTINFNGKVIEIDKKEYLGTRDRSWGIRPVGLPDPQPIVPMELPQFFWLWAPVNFKDCASHIYFVDDKEGNSDYAFARIQYANEDVSNFVTIEKQIQFEEKSRRIKSLGLKLISDSSDQYELTLKPIYNIFMCGLGYMHPDWGHGHYKGEFATHYDQYNLSEDIEDPPYLHIQSICDVSYKTLNENKSGRGVLEQLLIGPHKPSGFKDLLDKP